MRPVSAAFKEIVSSSHTPRARMRTVVGFPQSVSPTVTSVLPIVSGQVRMESSAIVRATADVTYSDDWGGVLPGGVEAIIEYGVERDGGSTEWVSLGYYRFDTVTQSGYNTPISAQLSDRMAMVRDSNAVYNYVIPATESHAAAFSGLLYGTAFATWGPQHGVFPPTALGQDIIYDYDAGTARVGRDIPLLDTDATSYYDVLQSIADSLDKRMFFDHLGRLNVVDSVVIAEASAAAVIKGGPGGTLRGLTRQVTRNGVYNSVVARGSAATEGEPPWWNSWVDNAGSSIHFFGPFGRITKYVESSAVSTDREAQYTAEQTLSRSKGMIYTLSLEAVSNPALEPLDTISVSFPGGVTADGTPPPPGMYNEVQQSHVIDSLTFPLTGGNMSITTRSGYAGAI